MALAEHLGQARPLLPGGAFDRRATLARERLSMLNAAGSSSTAAAGAAISATLSRFEAADEHALLSTDGANWHRGAAFCKEAAEADVLLPLLQQFGVARLVIGHTPTREARAVTRFDRRVVKPSANGRRRI